jgi:cytochrome c oxidase subunit III
MSEVTAEPSLLPPGSVSHRSSGWWAMMAVIASEAALFAYLLFSYYYFANQPHFYPWPPEPMLFRLSLPNTIILALSSLAIWWADRGTRRGARFNQLAGLMIGIVLGAVFVAIQILEWKTRVFTITSHPYGSLYFTITGFHMAHVVVGLFILVALLVWVLFGYFGPWRDAPVSIGAIYWHFVDVVWLAVFFTFYVTPHLA